MGLVRDPLLAVERTALTADVDAFLAVLFNGMFDKPVTELELPPVPAEPKKVTFNDLEGVLAEVKTTGWD